MCLLVLFVQFKQSLTLGKVFIVKFILISLMLKLDYWSWVIIDSSKTGNTNQHDTNNDRLRYVGFKEKYKKLIKTCMSFNITHITPPLPPKTTKFNPGPATGIDS